MIFCEAGPAARILGDQHFYGTICRRRGGAFGCLHGFPRTKNTPRKPVFRVLVDDPLGYGCDRVRERAIDATRCGSWKSLGAEVEQLNARDRAIILLRQRVCRRRCGG